MTVAWLAGKYLASPAFAAVGAGTQTDYRYALDQVTEHFGTAPLDEVTPAHVTLYLEHRGATSQHRARREKAVLSMLYAWAIARGFCQFNPAGAVRTKRLPGRKHVYITDEMREAVYEAAPPDLRDAMDLAYYLGQRPADLLSLTIVKVRDGMLEYRQQKTGTAQRVALVGGLAETLERIFLRHTDHLLSFQVAPLEQVWSWINPAPVAPPRRPAGRQARGAPARQPAPTCPVPGPRGPRPRH